VVAKWLGHSPKVAAQRSLMSRDHHCEDVVGDGESSPVAGADGVQGSSSEGDAISADRIELLTRAVILVVGMRIPESGCEAVLARVTAELANNRQTVATNFREDRGGFGQGRLPHIQLCRDRPRATPHRPPVTCHTLEKARLAVLSFGCTCHDNGCYVGFGIRQLLAADGTDRLLTPP